MICLGFQIWNAQAQKEMKLAPFTSLVVDLPVHLTLVQGKEIKVTHPESLGGLKFKVKNEVLTIAVEGDEAPKFKDLTLYFESLNSIDATGAAVIQTGAGKVLEGESLEINCNGAVKTDLNIRVNKLIFKGEGACQSTWKGGATHASVELSGAGKYQAADLKTVETDLKAGGASKFEVNASESLMILAEGASKGDIYGNPSKRQIKLLGLSKVHDRKTGENLSDERQGGGDDTTRITLGKKKLIIIEEEKEKKYRDEDNQEGNKSGRVRKYELKHVYTGVELGMNSFSRPGLNFSMPTGFDYLDCNSGSSWFIGLNILEGDLQLWKNRLALTSGLGFEVVNFNFRSDRILIPNANTVSADSGSLALIKNRLQNLNISVPLLVKFAPRMGKKRNGFHLAAGIIGSYTPGTQLVATSTALGYEQKVKVWDDFNVNPFRVVATFRAGYGWFRGFVNVGLTPYFRTNASNPDIRTFTAGITVVSF